MNQNPSFKARIVSIVTSNSKQFKSFFVDKEYLIFSKAFQTNSYYILKTDEDNYNHLTGIPFNDPALFFKKCINGILTENDISFVKKGQTEGEVKGSIRRKISALPLIINIFQSTSLVEENFSKNRIRCSFAIGQTDFTIGFTITKGQSTRSMTLLKGNEVDPSLAKPMDLVLSRNKGEKLFHQHVFGDIKILNNYLQSVKNIIDIENFKEPIIIEALNNLQKEMSGEAKKEGIKDETDVQELLDKEK